MHKRRSHFVPGEAFVPECLEKRELLSGIAAADVASSAGGDVSTKTTLAVEAGTLAQPITITTTVKAAASAGSPTGTVEIIEKHQVIGTLTLSPATATNGNSAVSEATAVWAPSPGVPALYFGKYKLTAEYIPSGAFAKSTATSTFTIRQPTYTTLAGGVKVATATAGSGPEIQSGQTAGVLYTGYLARNGEAFDDSSEHGGTPLSFTVGAGQVVTGFDEGTAGMQVGETRIISIPPSAGYGDTKVGSIPPNSKLVFVVTLESIS